VAPEVVVDARGISKSFQRGSPVLDNLTFSLNRGEMVALIGASGSGKSTLIRTLAGLVATDGQKNADHGRIVVLGEPVHDNGRSHRSRDFRARIGVIFQQYNLVPRLSVLTNVCLGLLGKVSTIRGTFGRFSDGDKRKVMHALARVGIAEHALKRASDLSGGQQQRAAIARTLVQGVDLLLADEPIASLDPASARRVMELLADMNRNDGLTVFVSLHQVEYALKYCSRTIALRAGKIVYDGPSSALTPAFLNRIYGAESEELLLFPSIDEQIGVPASNGHDGHPIPAWVVGPGARPNKARAKKRISKSQRLNA
jgi:phosphonate transport system ATP-binding protein